MFCRHFLYFSPQKKFLPFIKLLVQAADQDCRHLGERREAAADAGQIPIWGFGGAHGVTSSFLGPLSISWTRSLSAFTSSSSFSSCGVSGNFQVLGFVEHFLRGRKQWDTSAQHSGGIWSPPGCRKQFVFAEPAYNSYSAHPRSPKRAERSHLYAKLFVGVGISSHAKEVPVFIMYRGCSYQTPNFALIELKRK